MNGLFPGGGGGASSSAGASALLNAYAALGLKVPAGATSIGAGASALLAGALGGVSLGPQPGAVPLSSAAIVEKTSALLAKAGLTGSDPGKLQEKTAAWISAAPPPSELPNHVSSRLPAAVTPPPGVSSGVAAALMVAAATNTSNQALGSASVLIARGGGGTAPAQNTGAALAPIAQVNDGSGFIYGIPEEYGNLISPALPAKAEAAELPPATEPPHEKVQPAKPAVATEPPAAPAPNVSIATDQPDRASHRMGIEVLKSLIANKAKDEEHAAARKAAAVSGYAAASTTARSAESVWDKGTHVSSAARSSEAHDEEKDGESKVYIGGVPAGTSEGLIIAECKKYGSVSGIHYDAEAADPFDGGWALVTFAGQDSASAAVKRMSQRKALFGAERPVEVRLGTAEDDERVEMAREPARAQLEDLGLTAQDHDFDAAGARSGEGRGGQRSRRDAGRSKERRREAEYWPRSPKRRSPRRRRRRSRSRRKAVGRDTSEYSDSDSPAAGPRDKPTPVEVVRRRGLKGFDAAPDAEAIANGALSVSQPNPVAEALVGCRQVGVRGNWAEFQTPSGKSIYINTTTGDYTVVRPAGYDVGASRAPQQVSLATPGAHSNVFVGNLPPSMTEPAFRQVFGVYGNVVSIKVAPGTNYGFVKYSTVTEAQRCIDATNGCMFSGSELAVRFANKDRPFGFA